MVLPVLMVQQALYMVVMQLQNLSIFLCSLAHIINVILAYLVYNFDFCLVYSEDVVLLRRNVTYRGIKYFYKMPLTRIIIVQYKKIKLSRFDFVFLHDLKRTIFLNGA